MPIPVVLAIDGVLCAETCVIRADRRKEEVIGAGSIIRRLSSCFELFSFPFNSVRTLR